MSLLYSVVSLNVDLATRIMNFGRSQRYLLGITDEVTKHVIRSLQVEIADMFSMLIDLKCVVRFNGVKDTSPYAMASV